VKANHRITSILSAIAALFIVSNARAGAIFTQLYNLTGNSDATLVASSNGISLYGTTVGTGLAVTKSYGTIFRASTNAVQTFGFTGFSNLVLFQLTNGGAPRAGVILGPRGNLYGTTASYAISNVFFTNGMGSVFSATTNGSFASGFTVLHRFGSVTNSQHQPLDGASPRAPLVNGPSNTLYGTTYFGGSNGYVHATPGYGAVFKVTTNGTFTELHSFDGSDGANPTGLVLGLDTNLYGVTSYGGSNSTAVDTNGDAGFGSIYKMTANGQLTTLYSFGASIGPSGNALDGSQPTTLIQGRDGNFYGTTAFGGSNNAVVDGEGDMGCGTVFKVDTNGNLTSLYSFGASFNAKGYPLDGRDPSGPLVEGPDGNFYGVTQFGGATNTGTIFVITPTGALTTLYNFGHTNDSILQPPGLAQDTSYYPRGGLLVANDGNLYGTTFHGGTAIESGGSVFRFGPGAPDIVGPPGSITIVAGSTNTLRAAVDSLYAMSYQWQFDQTNLIDGGQLSGSSTSNLTLSAAALANSGAYTILVTNVVGSAQASATVKVVPAIITRQPASATIVAGATDTFTVAVNSVYPPSFQWQFDGTNLADGGEISGSSTSNLTLTGAAVSDHGNYSVIISNAAGTVQSSNAVLVVNPFTTSKTPSSLTIMAGAAASFGIAVQNSGSINFQWQFDGANLSDGGNVTGSTTTNLVIVNAAPQDSGTYSVIISNSSGSETVTALLRVIPQTAPGYSLSNVHSFSAEGDGGQPNGLFSASDGALYGTAMNGGTNGFGSLFKFTTNGTLATLYSFTGGSDQANPNSTLVQDGSGLLYGTTASQTTNQDGTVFETTTAGSLTTLAFFDSTNGQSPNGVTFGADGNLYGVCNQGGEFNTGTFFEVNPTNGALGMLNSCDAVTTGNSPAAGLLLGKDGSFYGTAALSETLFQIDSTGQVLNVYLFPGGSGGFAPEGQLVQAGNGAIYGTTGDGGATGDGTVFEFTNGVITNLYSFGAVTNFDGSFLDGTHPLAGLAFGPDGNLYGVTFEGGYNNNGTVFKITTNGVLTTIAWLDGADGSAPAAALALGADGNFYGTTQYGGTNNAGVIFQLAVVPAGPPRIQSVSASGGQINLSWNVTPGQSYQVQYTGDLDDGTWQNLGLPAFAAASMINVTDAVNQTQRFYRLILLP
jgi:uncharacterized repeat protein (TIGR03803 family)